MRAPILIVGLSVVVSWLAYGLKQGGTIGELRTGEEVYVSEGCIHCHSQYSRPGTMDDLWYGPASEVPDGMGDAVLIGNRRQGPDLSSVGLRRSREWNRAHLIDPSGISPGSRMPSYQRLFEGKGEDGEVLLDYLSGLVPESSGSWLQDVESWEVDSSIVGNLMDGQVLFFSICAQCHGESGVGDGVCSESFDPRPRNLISGDGVFVPQAMEGDWRKRRLEQIVKFGIRGTSMPGHEYLTDPEIVDLVTYVLSIESGRQK